MPGAWCFKDNISTRSCVDRHGVLVAEATPPLSTWFYCTPASEQHGAVLPPAPAPTPASRAGALCGSLLDGFVVHREWVGPVLLFLLLVCSHFSAGAPDVQLQRIAWATFVAVFVLVAMVFFLVRSLSCQ